MLRLLAVVLIFGQIITSECDVCGEYYTWNHIFEQTRLCADERWCLMADGFINDTDILENVTFAKVLINGGEDRVLPICGFFNMSNLETIDASKSQLYDVSIETFSFLPRLKRLDLSFNKIEFLRKTFISNVSSLEMLDLSWNKLYRLEERVFEGTHLEVLNLSRNELKYFKLEHDIISLKDLILSHNYLKILANEISWVTRHMRVLDLSFNELKEQPFLDCPIFDPCTVETLDLTHNLIKYFAISRDENQELRIADNLISQNRFVYPLSGGPECLLTKRVVIYPNPWICREGLTKILKHMYECNITILPPERDTRFNFTTPYPVCITDDAEGRRNYMKLAKGFVADQGAKCEDDSRCHDHMICRSGRCWNPCNYGACGSTEVCKVRGHRLSCSCPKGKLKSPFDYSSRCYNVECFVDADCEDAKLYCKNHICEKIPFDVYINK